MKSLRETNTDNQTKHALNVPLLMDNLIEEG